jgi:hypothetical protein
MIKFYWQATHWHNKYVNPINELGTVIGDFQSEFGEFPTKILVTNDAKDYLHKAVMKSLYSDYLIKFPVNKKFTLVNLLNSLQFLFFVVFCKILIRDSALFCFLEATFSTRFEVDDMIFYQYDELDKIILCRNDKYLVLYI